MKKKIFLLTTLTALVFGASGAIYATNTNMEQTQTKISKPKLTEAEKKEARAKRIEAKKEAEQKRREARLTAQNERKTSNKRHKKFLGIF